MADLDDYTSGGGVTAPAGLELETEAPSEAYSYSGKLDGDWRVAESSLLTLGTDVERLERDAIRTRFMPATGATFEDHIWPEAERDIFGLFGELDRDDVLYSGNLLAEWKVDEALALYAGVGRAHPQFID